MKRFVLLMAFIGLTLSSTNAQTQMLQGGNLEDVNQWQTSLLNTETGAEPTATWNYTTDKPTAGVGGNLHATGTTTAGNSQYCIYQEVTLSNEKLYTFDGAFKAAQINNSWCEIFIGTKPEDGNDYGGGQFRLAAFGTWAGYSNSDGVFSADTDAGNYKAFAPDTSGQYFFVMKMGSTSWDGSSQTFEIMVDELSLIEEVVAPLVDFSVDITEGYAPLTVQFTDASKFANSWAWNFGDGETSTDQNPSHTYAAVGSYTVTLVSTNEIGSTELIKESLVTVNQVEKVTAGGAIEGGNMEDASKWSTSILNTPAGSEAAVSWNNMEKAPTAGDGGALFVTGLSNNSTVQFAIYQSVTLSKDSIYEFNAAVKDFTASLNQSWYEVFVGGLEPADGLDYSKDDPANFLLSEFSTWSNECNPKGVDGTFLLHGCGNNSYIPPADGEYWFVLKMGSTSWAGDDMPFELAVDEISLSASRVAPIVEFSADKPLGFAPLTVQFTNESSFGDSWNWDFGDGSENSSEESPVHVYETVGTYTVTLTATNEVGSTEKVKAEYIKANEKPDLPEGEMLYGGNMEDPNLWSITQLNSNVSTTAAWNNTADAPTIGDGGNLLISADVQNGTSQYLIWQAIELKAGMKYSFSAAFKDISDNLDHFWSEVFIGTSAPSDGSDYGEGQTKIAFFNTWDCGAAPGLDGTYQDNACGPDPVGVFIPEADGTFYFAIKTGATDWEGNVYSFSVMIDEVSLMESENVPSPVADFFADITTGDAPLTVNFTDLSQNATSWAWDFGDGNTSTEQSPSHVYTVAGLYAVSLTASNEGGSHTLTVPDLIDVTGSTGIDEINLLNTKVYPNPSSGLVYIVANGLGAENITVFDLTGKQLKQNVSSHLDGNLTMEFAEEGVYFMKITNEERTIIRKVLIQK